MSIILFFFIYFTIVFIVLNYLYMRLSAYYRQLKYKDNESGKEIDLGEKFAPFRPHDPINYTQFIIFGLFLFPIKGILSLLICIFLSIQLKILKYKYKHLDTDPKESKIRANAIKFWSSIFLMINGISAKKEELKYEEVYKKYLGPDYDFKQEKYSLIISNHIGYFDVILNMSVFGCGFLAMKMITCVPIGGAIAADIGSIFVERLSEFSRKETFDDLMKRQKDFYEGKLVNDIVVFPEGTTSNNRYVVKFKQGAFRSLLPLKPMIIHIDKKASYHLCSNVTNLFFHVLRCFTTIKNTLYYCQLPIIKPTQYMYDNYSHLGKEKWDIYSSVVKNMYAEIGGFKQSELGHRDKDIYYDALETCVYNGQKLMYKE